MLCLSIISAIILVSYLIFCYGLFGVTEMIGDTYQKLQGVSKHFETFFSVTMFIVGLSILMCLLDSGQGIQAFAFGAGAGLMFISVVPNFNDVDVSTMQKIGAIFSAICNLSWCLSANCLPTIFIALIFSVYLSLCCLDKKIATTVHFENTVSKCNWLYWAEVAAFVDVYITYWLIVEV